jgi:hypothetical protein
MKPKMNEIALPEEVKRGRIDLTARREAVGLTSPMSPTEKSILEKSVSTAINEALGGEALLKAHESTLKQTLQELKRNRKTLHVAAKTLASQGNGGGGQTTT